MTMCSNNNNDFVLTLRGMRRKEASYAIRDYFGESQDIMQCDDKVDLECRNKMCCWTRQIVEYCKCNSETIALSNNLLDRFLQVSPWAVQDRSAFQLAAITCLYTTIKVHEPKALAVETMVALSRNVFTKSQIETTERHILKTVRWLFHPPTTFQFGFYFCQFLANTDKRYNFETLYELTEVQLDSAASDYYLALIPSSSVAYAAVMNAIESMGSLNYKTQNELALMLASFAEIDPTVFPMKAVQNRLYEGFAGNDPLPSQMPIEISRTGSPRTVSSISRDP